MHAAMNVFARHDVKGVCCEGYGSESGEFAELRIYLLSKMIMKPDMTFSEFKYHFNDFLNGYYGDGCKISAN